MIRGYLSSPTALTFAISDLEVLRYLCKTKPKWASGPRAAPNHLEALIAMLFVRLERGRLLWDCRLRWRFSPLNPVPIYVE
jgi:hypothetical protein